MKKITDYIADKGCIKINDICFSNGVGDGKFGVYYSETLPDGYEYIGGEYAIHIDFRYMANDIVKIYHYDCGAVEYTHFYGSDYDCMAIRVAADKDGNICLVKYFKKKDK